MSKRHRTLADTLRHYAAQSALSVNQLAQKGGVDQSNLNRFLNGSQANVRLDVAERLMKVLGLKVTRR